MQNEQINGYEAWGKEIVRLAKDYLHITSDDGQFQLPMDVWLPLYAQGLEPVEALDQAVDAVFETELGALV